VQVAIRTYQRRDTAAVADVFYRSVREVALSDYTTEQVKAWVPGRQDAEQEHRRCGDGRLVLVAADEPAHLVASTDLEPDGHIDRLFRAPEAAGARSPAAVCPSPLGTISATAFPAVRSSSRGLLAWRERWLG
jgi:hypothetical protein